MGYLGVDNFMLKPQFNKINFIFILNNIFDNIII